MSEQPALAEKLGVLRHVAGYKPKLVVGIVALNLVTAVFEGIGIGLLFPIIEVAQRGGELGTQATGATTYFLRVYEFVGVPFTFETLVVGLAGVMSLRYGLTFLTSLLQVKLRTEYLVYLRKRCFERLLSADVSYLDNQDGDVLTNTIVTEIAQSSGVVTQILNLCQTTFFVLVYAGVALVIAPQLTLVAVFVLGITMFLTRFVVRPGYDIGDQVAGANERIQSLVNAGVRGVREIKLFNMSEDLLGEYRRIHSQFRRTNIALARNQAALSNSNQLLNALAVFVLVYVAIGYLQLSFASLGVFLFAMFRLSPQISSLNDQLYNLDGSLPHLVRCHNFESEFKAHTEATGDQPAPDQIRSVECESVTFRYETDDETSDLTDISFEMTQGETVALVGPSGAGKSTIVALIARLYEPDRGRIRANGTDISQFEIDSWHERVAVVPQRPFIFPETLRYNLTVGHAEASDEEIRRACEISRVSSFLGDLPDGLDSTIGDDAIKLSGGQRQRIAIARALLTDADVLLLDEATSELDAPTEEAIMAGIESLNREYLTVVVGHDLSTVQDADQIYTIVDGRLVEAGTHHELIENGSHYAELYSSQIES